MYTPECYYVSVGILNSNERQPMSEFFKPLAVKLIGTVAVVALFTQPVLYTSILTAAKAGFTQMDSNFNRIFQLSDVGHKMLLKRQDSIVQVVNVNTSMGTAVRIAPGLYATARHVTEGHTPESMRLYLNADVFITPLKIIESPTHDVALIVTEAGAELTTTLTMPINLKNPKAHGIVIKVGHALGLNLTSAAGEATGLPEAEDGAVHMAMGGSHGDSGCPVFDEDGKLRGILVRGIDHEITAKLPTEETTHTTPYHRALSIIIAHGGTSVYYIPIREALSLMPNLRT